MRSRGALRRRWPLGLAALLGFLLLGSIVAAVVNGRRLQGSVPGKAPILGLAVSPNGFLIGTSDGVLSSSDGSSWKRVPGFEGESLVAGSGSTIAVVSGGALSVTSDLAVFRPVSGDLDRPTALTVTSQGQIWVADESGVHFTGEGPGLPNPVPLEGGPGEVLSLGVQSGDADDRPTILAGGLSSGLWRSDDGGMKWQRILGTPTRAILVDPAEAERYFIGTAGGVLAASRTTPEFTDLRLAVEALAESEGTFYAITAERLVYESKDGLKWTARPVPRK